MEKIKNELNNESIKKKIYTNKIENINTTAEIHELIEFSILASENDELEELKECYILELEQKTNKAFIQYGFYLQIIEKDYEGMIKYYLLAINNNNIVAMNLLATYYNSIKNYDQMKKYLLMIAENNNVNVDIEVYIIVCRNLALHYKKIEKNYNQMIKYYLLATDKGCNKSPYDLSKYYWYKEKNMEQMVIYSLIAIFNSNRKR